MKRKVIQIAGSTQLVSLPRQWAKAHNIQRGQEIDVQEDGNRIIISTETTPPKSGITIDLSGLLPRLADRFLTRAYQLGYDELNVRFDNLETNLALRKKVQELLGFEVFEQDHHNMLIKSITSNPEIDFEAAMRKAFTVALGMADAYLEAFKKSDRKELEALQYRDLELNRFCYFCLRAISKGMYKDFDANIIYYLIETLEDVGDAYKELGLALTKVLPSQNLVKIFENTNTCLRLSYTFFYKPSKETVTEAYSIMDETRKLVSKSMSTLKNGDEAKVLALFDYILRLIYHFPTMRLDTLKETTGQQG